ncbi:MAG TPA: hypothetical protein DCM86_12185 [Verrucomicrobiales bacterium]|nr:hypothetical protein [Verrucomicrobiales bacterium]
MNAARTFLLTLLVSLAGSATTLRAAEYYTSPSGRAGAAGTLDDPLDFTTAISSATSPAHAGDTLWVRGGIYKAPIPGFVFSISGNSSQPLIFRNYNNERAIIDGTFKAHGSFVYYWGLEFTDLSTPYLPITMTRSAKEALMLAGNYSFCSYYLESAASSKFINNIFHDSFGQIEYGVSSSNSLFYGNIVLNMGEQCSDTERGVGLYAQNQNGTRDIVDNIVGQVILNGIDIWSSGNAFINNFTADGNVCFNNGYGKYQGGRNMLSGAGNGCTNLLMVSNILAYCKDSYNRPNLIVGHGGQSFSPRILNNLMVNGGFELDESFGAMEFSGNELLSSGAWNNMYTVWPRDHKPTSYLFANNKYYGNPLIEVSIYVTNSATPAGAFTRLSVPGQWQGWQQLWNTYPAAGDRFLPDATSTYTAAKPTGTRVIIRPNRYDRTRANVTILNFDLKNTVDVDLSSLGLPPNTQYELHPVQNLFNQTNTGTYTGGPITVPMTGWGIRQPPGRALDLSSTFPQFGSFLFIARSSTGNTPPTVGTIPDQSINEDASTGPISFTLGDKESSPALLTLSAASSNLGLIPPENIVFGGSGGIRTVTLTPLAYQSGTAVITVTADDGYAKASQSFNLTVKPVNHAPVISTVIPTQTIPMNSSSAALTFQVGDAETAASSLLVTVTSSNPALLPDAGLVLSGSDAARVLKITPAAGVVGTAVVTIHVSDLQATTTTQFTVNVLATGTTKPPTITDIPDQQSPTGAAVRNIPFTIGDLDTALTGLTVTATSGNTTLLPASGVVLGGSGASRTISLTPVAGQTGSAIVTVAVSDGRNKALESFVLTVGVQVNTPPTISSLADISLSPGTPVVGPLSFIVGDAETPAASLAVGASSSNTSLVRASDIFLSGSGAVRSITVYPEPNQTGSSLLLLWVSDGKNSTTNSLKFTVRSANTPPTLAGLPASTLTMPEDTTQVIPFTIADAETPAASLQVFASSSDTNLLPALNLVLGGSDASRSLTITPAPNANGNAVVTVAVSDGVNITTSAFNLTVSPVPDGPSLAGLGDVALYNTTVAQPVHFTLSDPDLADPSLAGVTLKAWSSNPAVIPNANLVLGGSGPDRTLSITPAASQVGTNLVFLSASDGSLSTTQSFRVMVTPPNQAPVVDAGTNAAIYASLDYMLKGKVTDDGLPANPGRVWMQWSLVSGPGTVTLLSPAVPITAARLSTFGFYRMRLTATDGELVASDDVFVLVKPNGDTNPPVMTTLQVGEVAHDSITLSWTTDEPSNSQVEYGANGVFERNTLLAVTQTTSHSVTVTNLLPDTLYVLRAKSRDPSGNLATSQTLSVRTLRRALVYIPLTAATASLDVPMTLMPDTSSAGEPYLGTPTDAQGLASWDFYAPVPATYYVWARVYAPDTRHDSFDVTLDNGTPDTYDVAEGTWAAQWQWTRVNGRAGGNTPLTLNPRTFRLSAGLHTLAFAGREAQTLLSRVIVTDDPDFVPADGAAVSGVATASTLASPVYDVPLPPGWSLVANPLQPSDPHIAAMLPTPPAEMEYDRFNPVGGDYTTTAFVNGVWVDPSVTLGQGEGGFLLNPGLTPWSLVLTGAVAPNPAAVTLHPGLNLLCLNTPVAGNLRLLINNFPFVANDTVQQVDPETKGLVTHTFNGQQWDTVPVLNLGESIFINLVPR